MLRDSELVAFVNDGRFEVPTNLRLEGSMQVLLEIYIAAPAFGGQIDFYSCVTFVFRFNREDENRLIADPIYAHSRLGTSCVVDHLGFVLVDRGCVSELLRASGHGAEDDLLRLFSETEIATGLIADGAMIPVWGMRSWLYRIAVCPDAITAAPFGRRASTRRVFRLPLTCKGYHIIPGSALRSWTKCESHTWPHLDLPGAGASLAVELFTSDGYEPMDPAHQVGILPTLVIGRTQEEAWATQNDLFDGCDPFYREPSTEEAERMCKLSP